MIACKTDVWKTRDESSNLQQQHDSELIKEDKRLEVEDEVRIQVDELMREELNNLKMVCIPSGINKNIGISDENMCFSYRPWTVTKGKRVKKGRKVEKRLRII